MSLPRTTLPPNKRYWRRAERAYVACLVIAAVFGLVELHSFAGVPDELPPPTVTVHHVPGKVQSCPDGYVNPQYVGDGDIECSFDIGGE